MARKREYNVESKEQRWLDVKKEGQVWRKGGDHSVVSGR